MLRCSRRPALHAALGLVLLCITLRSLRCHLHSSLLASSICAEVVFSPSAGLTFLAPVGPQQRDREVMVSWEISSSDLSAIMLPMSLYWTVDICGSTQTGELKISAWHWHGTGLWDFTAAGINWHGAAGFYENGVLVTSSRRALMHYLKTWFLFDICVVGFDWVSWLKA